MKDPDNFSAFLPRCGRFDLFNFMDDLKNLWYETELKSVTCGYRDVNVFYLDQNDFDNQIHKLTGLGLLFQPLARIKSFDCFGHKHEISEEITKNTSIFGVISKDIESLQKFRNYYKEEDHFNMGLMLGYPECCCRAFSDYVRREIVDPIYEIAQSTPSSVQVDRNTIEIQEVPWKIQVHLRYFDLRVIPFLPCSFDCEEAQDKAEDWYRLLKDTNSGVLEILESLMKQPSVWDIYNSQVVVNGPPCSADFMGYATSTYYPERRIVRFLDVV